MNMRDDIELSILAEYGDIELAEAVGIALHLTWASLMEILGLPNIWEAQL